MISYEYENYCVTYHADKMLIKCWYQQNEKS